MTALLAAVALAGPDGSDARYRTAVFASSNEAAGQTSLAYADSDADKLAAVLESLGGFVDDARVPGATGDGLRRAIAALAGRVAAARKRGLRTEVVLYYSGHSDEDGLLLGPDRVSYGELRERIAAIGADVQIAILDSCASGLLVRGKGSVPHAPFLVDRSSAVTGTAVLTSSSGDEASQESDRIRGSFFTEALVTGLRGAADTSRDQRVSLLEAYHFAYGDTLARTEHTLAGAQHAAYDLDLIGTGDLVLTDLNATDATLEVDLPLRGRVFVWSERAGLLAELASVPARPVSLALPADHYTVLVDHDARADEASFDLPTGGALRLSELELRPAEASWSRLRGSSPVPVRHQLFSVGFLPPLLTGPPPQQIVVQHAALSFGVTAADRLEGLQLAIGGDYVRGAMAGAQVALGVDVASGPSRGVQLAGLGDVARDLRGVQIASLAALASRVEGVQLGSVGVARSLVGAQIGLVNVGGSVRGARIGLVNIGGEVHGAQIGLVNLARRVDGASVGLVSLSRQGYDHVRLLGGDSELGSVGLTSGSDPLYSVLQVGRLAERWSVGFGEGWHAPITERLFVDSDLLAIAIDRPVDDQLVVQARALAGLELAPHLAVVLGPTLSVVPLGRPDALTFLPVGRIGTVPIWAGAELGLRL